MFPDRNGPLDGATKELIFDQYERGIPVGTLAKKYERTRTAVYRVINEVRARRLLEQPVDYIHNAAFEDAEQRRRVPRADAGRGGVPRLRSAIMTPAEGRAGRDGPPVRVAAAEQGAGAAPVPEDELPEVQAEQAAAGDRRRASPASATCGRSKSCRPASARSATC